MSVRYLTPAEAAETLRVTPHAITRWCRSGKLKAVRAGNRWRISPADLEEFIKKGVPLEESPKVDGLAAYAS